MQLIVDEKKDSVLHSNPSTLSDVLLELSQTFETQGRALLGIVLDGQALAPEELSPQWGTQSISDIGTLEVTSASLSGLVQETLEEIAEVVVELPVACREIAQTLLSDSPASCFGYFNQLLEIWDVLKERQTQIMANIPLPEVPIELQGTLLDDYTRQLDVSLTQAKKLMESSSFAALSDLMLNDLITKAEKEIELIEQLRGLVASN